jgi:hypothetical protein
MVHNLYNAMGDRLLSREFSRHFIGCAVVLRRIVSRHDNLNVFNNVQLGNRCIVF